MAKQRWLILWHFMSMGRGTVYNHQMETFTGTAEDVLKKVNEPSSTNDEHKGNGLLKICQQIILLP